KVVVASDGNRPNIVAASALALVTTFCAEVVSFPLYVMGQQHKSLFTNIDKVSKDTVNQIMKEGRNVNHFKIMERNGDELANNFIRSLDSKKDVIAKKFFSRTSAGTLVLVFYEEIQKWMH
ncbi:hypothetical protein PMAYCL1PPCAC_20592, partial [Pristionchus mayeri]